jgi:uncharacterized protein YbaP (TraB family)
MLRRPALLSRCLMFWLATLLLVAHAEAANDRGLVFSARRGDAQIILLGSINLGNAAVYPLRKEILDAYRQADVLVFELEAAEDQLAILVSMPNADAMINAQTTAVSQLSKATR